MDILTTAYLPARGEMQKKCADRPAVGTLFRLFGFLFVYDIFSPRRIPQPVQDRFADLEFKI